jgi:hypothetical protein
MISNEEHEEFLTTIDESIKGLISQNILDSSEGNITFCVNHFYEKRYNRTPEDIIWVKQGNTPITEFYSSELMLPWLVTFMKYYNRFLSHDFEKEVDLEEIYQTCAYLAFVLTKIKGINIIDDTVYLLENDLEFIQYKLDQKVFI